jgi:soluble lytic murein transglycosylase-like protein
MYDTGSGESWSMSAAAFWAGRAAGLAGDRQEAVKWFARAAPAKTTFYGMLAARALNANNPKDYDPAAWPIPRWKPQSGFTVDPALIYAIARQESRFDPQAESDSGAIGLMQLMPETAKALNAKKNTPDKNGIEDVLYNPEANLELGQRYVRDLLTHADIGGNLITMAVAYNGGPGNLARWRRGVKAEGDPLLFLETLPAGETRGFIEQVLTNYWIYRVRLGESTESLSDLTIGKWPRYKAPAPQAVKPTILASLQPISYSSVGNY